MKRCWLPGAAVVVLALGLVPAAARAQTSPQAPIRVGGNIVEPRMIKHVDPVYPEAARAAGVGGIVILEVVIGTDGRVSNATILRHVELLDQAALAAVMQWEFQPTLLNGVPVPVIMTTTVNFPPQPSSVVSTPQPQPSSPQPSPVTSATPAAGQAVRTLRAGGAVPFPAPKRIKDVVPELPDSVKQAGFTGVVILEIAIGTTGKVEAATIRVHHLVAGVDLAVIDAVKQWEFARTMLNGVPVRVVMSVRVDFTKDGVQVTMSGEPTPETKPATVSDDPAGPAASGQPLRVGGNIPEPIKIRNVSPVYPPEAQQARLQGSVIIEAVIDAEGNVADTKVLHAVEPSLGAAALDAVRQWKYKPTLLNGVPVPIIMIVTVKFVMK
jgi:TonB family protein